MNEIRLIKPYIRLEDVEDAFRDIFAGGVFTKGKYLEMFRQRMMDITACKNVFGVTSATTALSVSLKACGVSAGDEVIVADFSFPATANVVEDIGATPVFADVDLTTFNMDATSLQNRICRKTKAVIFVDTFGNLSGISAIAEICKSAGIPLIEDAACAIGSCESGKPSGDFADIACFSFHPRKLITSGEGGAVVTRHYEWAQWLNTKLNHGATGRNGIEMEFGDYGYNYRMNELQAAMLLPQLDRLDEVIQSRNTTRLAYIEKLASHGFVPQAISSNARFNCQSIVFVLPDRIDRDAVVRLLSDRGIESTLGTYSLSNLKYYREHYRDPQTNSKYLQSRTLTLPCYDGVDVERVSAELVDCVYLAETLV